MIKTIAFIGAAALILAGAADAKTLVAYYSRSGNTEHMAKLIQSATNADIFEIKTEPADFYPAEYTPMTEVAKQEIENGTMPTINAGPDLTQYDTIFIGTPIWWGTMASPVRAFLTNNSMNGKTIAPFATHGGGGAGTSFTDIAKITQGATVTNGYAVYGNDATESGIKDWLTNINLK